MDLRTRLTVFHDDGGAFSEFSAEAQNFTRDPFTITLTTDDFLYIGFRKPINALYAQMATTNTLPTTITAQYYTSDAVWSNVEISDDTKGLTRSAFITWNRPTDSEAVTVNGEELHWIRFSVSSDTSAVDFQAINLILADDNDMAQEVPDLIDDCFYPDGQTSHILQHVASKNYIMSRLRTLGYVRHISASGAEENIDQWDILDIYELRTAATYYSIAQVYFNISDNVEDQYWSKYQEYIKKFEEAFNLGRLRIDQNDNGQEDANEKRPIYPLSWNR